MADPHASAERTHPAALHSLAVLRLTGVRGMDRDGGASAELDAAHGVARHS